MKVFRDGACTQAQYTLETTAAYSLKKSPKVTAAFDLDLTLISASVTPADTTAAALMNSADLHGVSTWVAGQTQTFSDLTTGGWTTQFYDLVVIQPTYLFWGDLSTGDGLSASTRPTAVDSADYELRR